MSNDITRAVAYYVASVITPYFVIRGRIRD